MANLHADNLGLPPTLTIGQLAKAAGVGVETIRYYQKRTLLPTGTLQDGAIRRYPASLVQRIAFIKRAQKLGFVLDEIVTLLQLDDGLERCTIRQLANERLHTIQQKIADLQHIEKALQALVEACHDEQQNPTCPIIATLGGEVDNCTSKAATD
ncbi:MAG: MerR family transcriptional regulator [Burkholderiales bacterium]|nr:MerR family transcriptional regulator [Burkholderiales bacterium]